MLIKHVFFRPYLGPNNLLFVSISNPSSVMSSFRNFMTENNSKEGNNMLSMYLDIDMVSRIADHQVERKFHQLKQLVSNYFDPDGKRYWHRATTCRT